jgi:hypothetical protein
MEHPFNIILKPYERENKDMKNGINMCANGNKEPSSCKMGFNYAKNASKHYLGAT